MRTYFFRNRKWFSWIYPEVLWEVATEEKVLYLTFDDGPHPEATPFALDCLARYEARATFFCIGERIDRHPELLFQIREQGHAIGNHSMWHTDGWKTDSLHYMEDVNQCSQVLRKAGVRTDLFRPPYGNLRPGQLKALKATGLQVVMWSHLSGDFDPKLHVQMSLKCLKRARPGSILLFHDSEKACQNLQQLLPEVLTHFTTLGFSFKTLNQR